jgi:ABC-type branched-subunit amino acid transport system substrate-binding protein
LAFAPAAGAEDGVTAKEVVVGMVNAQSGPAAALGTNLKAGAMAYFNRVNAEGGVHGRKFRLVGVDDGYEPARTAAATKKLLDEDKVFALFGYVGTPTSAAAVPLASKAGVPYFGAFTGAEFLRNPVNKVVFNVRASYFDETEQQVDHLAKDLGIKNIALMIQDDAFGEAGKAGVNRALHKRGMKVVGEARYQRNTVDVEPAVATLSALKPEAIVMIGAYKSLAAFVNKYKATGQSPKFLTVSFVGTTDYIKEAGEAGEETIISQVVPSPYDPSHPTVAKYLTDFKAAGGGSPDYTSLEGYIDAVIFVEAVKRAGTELTRAALIAALEGMHTDVAGMTLGFAADRHQGLADVYFTRVKGGKAVPISKF